MIFVDFFLAHPHPDRYIRDLKPQGNRRSPCKASGIAHIYNYSELPLVGPEVRQVTGYKTEEKQKTSCSAVRQRYETQLKETLTWPEVTAKVNEDVDAEKKEATELIEVYLKLMDRLREFAERLIATSPYKHQRFVIPMLQVIDYVNTIIQCEQSGSSTGYEERISNLRKLRTDAHSLRLSMSKIFEDESDYQIPNRSETGSECETGEDEDEEEEDEDERYFGNEEELL